MRILTTTYAVSVLALAGCGTGDPFVPKIEKESYVQASDIMLAAQCELNAAADRAEQQIKFTNAGVVLTLTVIQTKGLSGTAILGVPLGAAAFTATGTSDPKSKSTKVVSVTLDHSTKKALDCSDTSDTFEGDFGLVEWIEMTENVAAESGQVPTEIGYTMTFELTHNGSLKPNVKRDFGTNSSRSFGLDATDNRVIKHNIAVTIKKPAAGASAKASQERTDSTIEFLKRVVDDI